MDFFYCWVWFPGRFHSNLVGRWRYSTSELPERRGCSGRSIRIHRNSSRRRQRHSIHFQRNARRPGRRPHGPAIAGRRYRVSWCLPGFVSTIWSGRDAKRDWNQSGATARLFMSDSFGFFFLFSFPLLSLESSGVTWKERRHWCGIAPWRCRRWRANVFTGGRRRPCWLSVWVN